MTGGAISVDFAAESNVGAVVVDASLEGRTVGVGFAATTGFCAQALDAPLAWRAVLVATADLSRAEIEAAGIRTDRRS